MGGIFKMHIRDVIIYRNIIAFSQIFMQKFHMKYSVGKDSYGIILDLDTVIIYIIIPDMISHSNCVIYRDIISPWLSL